MVKKTTASGVVALVTSAVIAAGHAVAGIEVPPAGTTLTYDCEGPWTKQYVDKIAWVRDGIVRTEGTNDGKAFWIEEPVYTFGLTLFTERESSKGTGRYTQSFDIDNLEQLAELKPGSTYGGSVTERNRNGRWTWRYDISVGEPQTIDHPTRGKVDVIPVTEKRMSYQGSYSAVITSSYEKNGGLFIRWHYKDPEGEETCDLVKVE